MPRFFSPSRSGSYGSEPLAGTGVDRDAHGCPICPHPAGFLHDDDSASTLLPVNHLSVDGQPLQLETVMMASAEDFDSDFEPLELEIPD